LEPQGVQQEQRKGKIIHPIPMPASPTHQPAHSRER
jgi:hypothetical protein